MWDNEVTLCHNYLQVILEQGVVPVSSPRGLEIPGWRPAGASLSHIFHIYIHISYFKHIYTGYKFNKDIVLQFGPVKIKVPNKLFTNKLIDKNKYIWRQ